MIPKYIADAAILADRFRRDQAMREEAEAIRLMSDAANRIQRAARTEARRHRRRQVAKLVQPIASPSAWWID